MNEMTMANHKATLCRHVLSFCKLHPPTKMSDSVCSSPADRKESYDFGDQRSSLRDSDGEDDVSEYDLNAGPHRKDFTEMKEQMYQAKLKRIKEQLEELQAGTFPDYLKRLKRIDQQYKERIRLNEVWQDFCMENAQRSYGIEMEQSRKEFEVKKVDLKERLISDYEEKKRQVENDKTHMELSMDFLDFKPISTRKLRRRINPDGNAVSSNGGVQEKRRKQSPTINILLDDALINEDLKIINKVSGKLYTQKKPPPVATCNDEQVSYDARIEDNKLYFEKRWYLRGQAIYADSKETGKFGAVIHTIGSAEIWIKKTSDNSRMRILLTQLQKGKYSIRRRST